MPISRQSKRDTDGFDTTQLKLNGHGKLLHRDYSAHFFRWSFARRLIKPSDDVLEIGCGEEMPLSKILTRGAAARVNNYVGVDMNKLKPSTNKRLSFVGEFDFTKDWKKLDKRHDIDAFDVVVHLEVIEHMGVPHGRKLLKGCHALLKNDGVMIMSTPVYDGKRHAANHIHEYTVEELEKEVKKAGFVVERRFGTFMDVKYINKVKDFGSLGGGCQYDNNEIHKSVSVVKDLLKDYFDNDAISNIFGPLFPDHSRNNIWICKKVVK